MDVSAPYRAVVPSLDGPVLMTLHRLGRPATGRRIHRLTGVGSEAGVRKILTRLVEHGLVSVSEAGSSLLYEANRTHLAWPVVEQLASLRAELIKRMSHEIRSWSSPPRSVAMFGSTARGDGDTASDIDVVLVRQGDTDGDESWEEQMDLLRERIEEWTGNRCQVYPLSAEELQTHVTAQEPIVAKWRSEALTIAGEDFRQLLVDAAPKAPE